MDQVIAIVQRELLLRVRRPAFLIGTLIAPVLMLGWLAVSGLLFGATTVERNVLVLDQSNDSGLFKGIETKVASADLGTRFNLSHVPVPPTEDIEDIKKQHDREIRENVDRALIVLPAGVLAGAPPEYYGSNTSDTSIANLNRVVSSVLTARRLARNGVDPEKVDLYSQGSDFSIFKMSPGGDAVDGREGSWIPFVLFFLIYISISRHSMSVMLGMLEEKQSSVLEVVVSSVKPLRLMAGKLLGISLVGLIQISIWGMTLILLRSFAASILGRSGVDVPSLPLGTILLFVMYFLIGYFLYGTIYAILGAVASRPEDIPFLTRPITLLKLIPLFGIWIVIKDPNSTSSVVLSLIPLFAPSLMVLRLAIFPPPLWQILLSIVLILLTTIGGLWLAAKVYRVGILLHGQRLTLSQIGRWLRFA